MKKKPKIVREAGNVYRELSQEPWRSAPVTKLKKVKLRR